MGPNRRLVGTVIARGNWTINDRSFADGTVEQSGSALAKVSLPVLVLLAVGVLPAEASTRFILTSCSNEFLDAGPTFPAIWTLRARQAIKL